MRWFRPQLRLILLAAWLALGAQGLVAFESVWHHHDDSTDGHQDSCAVCAAVAERGQPIDPPDAAPTSEFRGLLPLLGRESSAHLFALTSLGSRDPPATLAL